MSLAHLHNGDVVCARVEIKNDGSVPGAEEDALFANRGAKGMLLNIGHLEEDPNKELFLVTFEDISGELGPPVACLAEEISTTPVLNT
jgi:nitrogen fixation protein NifZ